MTLVAFDFDGTLSQFDVSVLLGKEYGVGGEMQGIVDQGESGAINMEQSLEQRGRLLKGMPERMVERAIHRCKLRKGVADLLAALHRRETEVAIITASFERAVNHALAKENVSVSHVIANRLEISNGAVTGKISGPLVSDTKDSALERIIGNEHIPVEQTIAIGNGMTDLPMIQRAETGIGYRPVKQVRPYCDEIVTSIRKLRLYFEQNLLTET